MNPTADLQPRATATGGLWAPRQWRRVVALSRFGLLIWVPIVVWLIFYRSSPAHLILRFADHREMLDSATLTALIVTLGLVATVLFASASLAGIVMRLRQVATFPRVPARVISARVNAGSRSFTSIELRAQYEFEGAIYKGEIAVSPVNFPSAEFAEAVLHSRVAAGRCEVAVDPAEPSRAYLPDAAAPQAATGALFVILFLGAIAAYLFDSHARAGLLLLRALRDPQAQLSYLSP